MRVKIRDVMVESLTSPAQPNGRWIGSQGSKRDSALHCARWKEVQLVSRWVESKLGGSWEVRERVARVLSGSHHES